MASEHIHRVALVTGAGSNSGLGKAIAESLAEAGNIVAVNDLEEKTCAETAEAIARQGGRSFPAAGDVADAAAVESIVDRVLDRAGRIDILVNCVGIRTKTAIGELDPDEVRRVLLVNLAGVILCVNAVARPMIRQRYGRIVSIGSTGGRRGGGEYMTSTSIYGASKAGIGGFSRSVARELGPHGITVNVVAPFLIDVPGRSHGRPPEMVEQMVGQIPMRRLGVPAEVAACIRFLASEEAGYVTGVELDVSGGYHMEG